MSANIETSDLRGSLWHRWDPHLHAPGTLLNDQFGGDWDGYTARINESRPPIHALGVTDYFSIGTYRAVKKRFEAGEFPHVGFIFPNVEMRLTPHTAKHQAINIHLLFSPDEEDHERTIERILSQLEFRTTGIQGRSYRCDEAGLIELGRQADPDETDSGKLKASGANQFKVSLEQIVELFRTESWLHSHCLVAVSGGKNDGTSGLQHDDAYMVLRREIEKFSHIVFSATPSQREYWLGRRPSAPVDEIERLYGSLKPCLHGSDCHETNSVGTPALDRFCWLKGDLSFETLRQACLEPEGRVFIGGEPPRGALQSHTIDTVAVSNASWLSQNTVQLNPGLVAVIGARGSGKTALADIIAAAGLSLSQHLSDKSFIRRAREHLGDCAAQLLWESGETTANDLTQTDLEGLLDTPRVQYLSQQFVDKLCSAEGLTDALVQEIEQVIFNAHTPTDRLGAGSFRELLAIRLESSHQRRSRQRDTLGRASAGLTAERTAKAGLRAMEKDREDKSKAIEKDKVDRKALVAKGNEQRAKRHEEVSAAVDAKRQQLDRAKRQHQALLLLQADVADLRDRQAPNLLEELKEARADAGLSETDWKAFGLDYVGEVDALLTDRIKKAKDWVAELKGPAKTDPPVTATPDVNVELVPAGAALSILTLSLLERELARLRALVGMDVQNAKRFTALSDKITKAEAALLKVMQQIEHVKDADERIRGLIESRRKAYVGVFEAILEEEQALASLYAPIKARIDAAEGSLSQLSFSVRRRIDIEAWTRAGEALLDLRTNGPFKGRGELLRIAKETLLVPWTTGDAQQAASALLEFARKNEDNLKTHRPEAVDVAVWASQVSAWLFGTDHISVGYGLQYDSVEIEQLSPGTRGIVLLLLYLAIDAEDDRPLIIDQPEENLDPQSIFNELVQRFRAAKGRRQIIIVTHNANLVVNTDADQVIVATCGSHRPGQLPVITYESGSLENARIRQHVCNILEGGERAFKERAKRLRLAL